MDLRRPHGGVGRAHSAARTAGPPVLEHRRAGTGIVPPAARRRRLPILFLSEQPFAPPAGAHYVLSMQDAGGGAVFRGRLDIPSRPSFAEEPR